ncbi:hypothetical protein [Acinetobacter ursingii]|uniref:hypothetical protein n=1 Tax=Acinetobacter ursingii TaxID=108980 RepID=UPI00125079DA|nr:hypothetical protein [Acinetobacter ursingii]
MNSILTEELREDFFIRLYFGNSNDFYNKGIKRAFLDFSRTLKIYDDNRKKYKYNSENFLLDSFTELINKEISNQEKFDYYHKNICETLIIHWNELKLGQSQKWINMTLKYWLLFGEKRIHGIEKNAKYFHIPIDRYVQKGMFKEKNPKAWSKIDNYESYMSYQIQHRNKQTGNFPIIDEFNFFNVFCLSNNKPKEE